MEAYKTIIVLNDMQTYLACGFVVYANRFDFLLFFFSFVTAFSLCMGMSVNIWLPIKKICTSKYNMSRKRAEWKRNVHCVDHPMLMYNSLFFFSKKLNRLYCVAPFSTHPMNKKCITINVNSLFKMNDMKQFRMAIICAYDKDDYLSTMEKCFFFQLLAGGEKDFQIAVHTFYP